MPVETVMARIQEIRTVVGLVEAQPAISAPVKDSSSTTLGEAFSTELSAAVKAGDTTTTGSLIQSLTGSSYTGVNPAVPAATDSSRLDTGGAPTVPASSPVQGAGRVEAPDSARTDRVERTPEAATVEKVPAGAGDAGDRVVSEAKKYLGVPYVWGGTNPAKGLDCSGLVQLVFKNLGYDLPRVARQQAKVGTVVPSLAQARPGDLIGMRNGTHIAIYLGDNKILHAPRPGEKVSIRSLTSRDDIDVIRRVAKDKVQASTVNTAEVASLSQALRVVDSFTTAKVGA